MSQLTEIINNTEIGVVEITDEHLKNISDKYGIGKAFSDNGYEKNWMLHNKYYKYLCSYSRHYMPKRVLELGTQTGAGTACFLASCFQTHVDTVDVNPNHISPIIKEHPRVTFHHTKEISEVISFTITNAHKYDLIFIDIGHDGIIEEQLHQQFKIKKNYYGLVFYDDIKLNESMWNFWCNLDSDNAFETDWHDDCGFGVVLYP